jgi:hypothetical protein
MSESKIKFKRKVSSGAPTRDDDKILAPGEPFYNTADKHLYVGNSDGELIDNKKHVAEVAVTDGGTNYKVSIGEDTTNCVEFTKDTFKAEGNVISLDLSEIILDGGTPPKDSTTTDE